VIPVYVLHCQELPDRTKAIRTHLEEKGISATYWKGFHGNTWGIDTRKEYESGHRISPGHVGLNLGIWALWQHISLTRQNVFVDPTDAVIILEDDAVVPENFLAQVGDLQIRLNYDFPDWDLVFLGLAETEPHIWHKVTERIGRPNSPLCRLDSPFGTHAIMLRRRALPVLLEHMAVAHKNLDQQLYERVLKPGHLKWCAVLPSIVTQRTFDYKGTGKPEWTTSTIDTDTDPNKIVSDYFDAHMKRLILGQEISKEPEEKPPGNPDPELVAATVALSDPNPCLYRGEATDRVARAGGVVLPLYDCGQFDRDCFNSAVTRHLDMPVALECKSCTTRVQMALDSPRERLPLPEGHFNPSIHLWQGKLILATRDSWGHSKVALWELRNAAPDWSGAWTCTPIGSFAGTHPDAPRLEDPRLFVSTDPNTGKQTLCSMFNLPDGYPPKRVRVGYLRFAHDLSGVTDTVVFQSPHKNLYEKNWVPFESDGELKWVYSTKPEHLVLSSHGHELVPPHWATQNPLPWVGGTVRGGAAPVLISGPALSMTGSDRRDLNNWNEPDRYYHFFHGCLKRIQGSVYTVGCSVFEAHPPYKVLRQTKVPLLWPDLPAAGEDVVKRYVLWPGGAVPHQGKWWLACGIDDTDCRMISLPFGTVENALNDVPEEERSAGQRESSLTRSVPDGV
jgi:GR25 family glycosyltransferase involved in LPS biosynthesis